MLQPAHREQREVPGISMSSAHPFVLDICLHLETRRERPGQESEMHGVGSKTWAATTRNRLAPIFFHLSCSTDTPSLSQILFFNSIVVSGGKHQ